MKHRSQPGYNVTDLLREIEVLREENAALRARETARAKDGIETFNAVMEALRHIQPGKETNAFFVESEKKISAAAPEDRPLIINARIKTAAARMKDHKAPALVTTEGPDPLRYDSKTLNQKRGEAIVHHLHQTARTAIKSNEARSFLEGIEGRKLDRKAVWRALRVARGILGATLDLFGGILRLIVPSSPRPGDHRHVTAGGGGERVTSPRPRRWSVPWDGAD